MDTLIEALRACLDGKDSENYLANAINRRGKPIKVRVTCNRLRTREVNRGGLLVLMEEWPDAASRG